MLRLLVFALGASALSAAEGIPDWERLLDRILADTGREQASPSRPEEPDAERTASIEPVPPLVQRFLRYFSSDGRPTLDAGLRRLAPHRTTIESIFAAEGVPSSMLWLGLVESGFEPAARSPKEAVGMWQFIPATAARYGLLDGRRDDRQDIEKSTRAAARYLRFLYQTFGDWNLALAAYNGGENRVAEALRRSGSRDLWTVARWLPRETQAYVPAVLAVQMLAGDKPTSPQPRLSGAVRTWARVTVSP
jgi:hypothetical protein